MSALTKAAKGVFGLVKGGGEISQIDGCEDQPARSSAGTYTSESRESEDQLLPLRAKPEDSIPACHSPNSDQASDDSERLKTAQRGLKKRRSSLPANVVAQLHMEEGKYGKHARPKKTKRSSDTSRTGQIPPEREGSQRRSDDGNARSVVASMRAAKLDATLKAAITNLCGTADTFRDTQSAQQDAFEIISEAGKALDKQVALLKTTFTQRQEALKATYRETQTGVESLTLRLQKVQVDVANTAQSAAGEQGNDPFVTGSLLDMLDADGGRDGQEGGGGRSPESPQSPVSPKSPDHPKGKKAGGEQRFSNFAEVL